MKILPRIALALVGTFFAVELFIWAGRVIDIPTYRADDRIGYLPRPSQSGLFLWSIPWHFNELSMGTERAFRPSERDTDVLLIGDSIVHGSNSDPPEERLAAQLERKTGWAVWPISAPSWSLQNQLTYLRDHPEVVDGADRIIFVLNAGDFAGPSSWTSEFLHPLERPFPGSWYLFRKYLLKPAAGPPPAPVRHWPDLPAELQKLVQGAGKPVRLFFYTGLGADGRPASCETLPEAYRRIARWQCVAASPHWSAALYKDGVHPTAQGNEVIASMIAWDQGGPPAKAPVPRR